MPHLVGRSGLLGMEDRLKTLRRDAQAQQCDFKAFTILREPERRELSEVAARPNATVEDACWTLRRVLVGERRKRPGSIVAEQVDERDGELTRAV